MKNNKEEVLLLNRKIKELGLVFMTWGNVSCLSVDKKNIIIKPSGIDLSLATPEDMSVVNLKTKALVSGKKQSVDTDIHIELYRNFKNVECVIHTHSKYATLLAQMKLDIKCTGTTHADYFDGSVPVVYDLKESEIENNYESNLGISIVKYFKNNQIDPVRVSAALLPSHGPIVWGKSKKQALENARVLEFVSELYYYQLASGCKSTIDNVLLRKHYDRKHGKRSYYGQN